MKFTIAFILVLVASFLYLTLCPLPILPDGESGTVPAERVQEPFNDDLRTSSIHKLQSK